MNARKLLKLCFSTALVLFFAVPTAHAGPLADAFEKTTRTSNFSYEADASISFEKGGESDLPFVLSISAEERGGKSDGVYGKNGFFTAMLSDIEDVPTEFQDMSYLKLSMEYSGASIESTKTSFAELTAAYFDTDGSTMSEITGMMNQMIKFFTGKAFRISQAELVKTLSELMGPDKFMGSEEEFFLSALTGTQSINEIASALGEFLDDLVDSGFLKMDIGNSFLRRTGVGGTGGTSYRLSMGNEISVEGARIFRNGLADFIGALFPGLGQMMAEELLLESPEVIASDINDFFREVGGIDFELTLNVQNGRLSDISLSMDLSRLDVPLSFQEEVRFNYSNSYQPNVPQDENRIIDLNQIVKGFIAIGQMGASIFEPSYPYDDYYYEDYSYDDYSYDDYYYEDPVIYYEEPFILPPDSLVVGDVEYIRSLCGYERLCILREIRGVQRNLRIMMQDGFITRTEYRRAFAELKKALR